MKIDLVYLWVDGSDEKWLVKKNAELEKIGKLPVEAAGDSRFYDNSELLFSLRSVEKFANWVNHIFIVTDNQIPKWLDINHPKITIVDHTEIMPQDALPCFSSTVIEFFIPYIPKLSEHFLLANDDTLFMAKTKPGYFFTKNGVPVIRVRNGRKIKKRMKNLLPIGQKFKTQWERGNIYDSSKLNSIKLVYDIVGDYNYRWYESHNIDPYKKSDMVNILEMPLVKKELEITKKNHFRNKVDIHRTVFHKFGVAKYKYKMVGNDFLTRMFQYLTLCFREQPTYTRNIRKKMLYSFRRKLMCIDDPMDVKIRKSNHNYLAKMFSNKSEFEK
jgi:hypothetical protein